MNKPAMDGPRATAHGALLVALTSLLCAGAPAIAHAAASEPYIVVYKTTSAAAGRATTADIAAGEAVTPTQRFGTAVRGFAAKLDATELDHIRDDPRVAEVIRDRPVRTTALSPMLTGDSIPRGIRRVGAAVDSNVRQASTANVAVIDTGIDLTHPDLNAVSGTDCTGSGTAQDGNGHGTHVAGTIGARNDGAGAVGVAPGTKLWAVRVLGSDGSGLTSQVVCGIDWVTATRTDSNPDNDISVANMSLGGSAPPTSDCGRSAGDAMHIAICSSVAAGVTYVVSAGNSGADEQNYAPASFPEVLTVTAIGDSDGLPGAAGGALSCTGGEDDTTASFSNFATRAVDIAHTIAAPGACIRSTYPGGYTTMSGTSMASPHVAGLVALCMGDGTVAGPCAGKTPAQVHAIVRRAAADQSAASPWSGFAGDPTRPVSDRYYGYLGSTRFPGVAPPTAAVAPATTVKPAVSGSALVGSTLSSTTGTWTGTAPIAYARQWLRCTSAADASCTAIDGQTGASYVLVSADAGRYLRVRVTATNSTSAVQALSEPTAVVATAGGTPVLVSAPVITGTMRTGELLTASNGTWTGGLPMSFRVEWATCAPGSSTCYYNGALGSTYRTPADTPAGTRVVVVVTAQNAAGIAYGQSMPTAPLTAAV